MAGSGWHDKSLFLVKREHVAPKIHRKFSVDFTPALSFKGSNFFDAFRAWPAVFFSTFQFCSDLSLPNKQVFFFHGITKSFLFPKNLTLGT